MIAPVEVEEAQDPKGPARALSATNTCTHMYTCIHVYVIYVLCSLAQEAWAKGLIEIATLGRTESVEARPARLSMKTTPSTNPCLP